MVLARTRPGTYVHGFLLKRDTHHLVDVYQAGEVRHAVQDTTAVIVDRAPDRERLVVGASVVAEHPKLKHVPAEIVNVRDLWMLQHCSHLFI